MSNPIYQPLSPDEIRLLRFLPGNGITAKLETWNLHRAHEYIALSYTWGLAPYRGDRPSDVTYAITLNEHSFSVQENLHDALMCLTPELRQHDRLLWIDAICINQNDIPERNAQILLMRYIYEHATLVYGWIGLPSDLEQNRLAIQLMRKFNKVLHEGLVTNNDDMNAVASQISPDNKEIFPEVGTDCYRGWLGIQDMFKRSYWRRTWIYQEATGPPAYTRFYCGSSYFNMTLVSASVFMAHHFSEFTQLEFPFRNLARGPLFAISAFRTEGVIAHGDSLLELIDSLRGTQASQPRDKAYALLGLAADLQSASIKPDYGKSLCDVYTDIVRFSLSQPKYGLQILGHVIRLRVSFEGEENTYIRNGFPSWVPDYREYGVNLFQTLQEGSKWAYNACGPYNIHSAHIDGRRLILQGYQMDRISSISAPWEHDVFSTREVEAWAPEDPTAIYSPTGQTLGDAFHTTILADMNVVKKSRGHMADLHLMGTSNDGLTADQHKHKNWMNVALKCASGVRRLCWTEAGRMGIVAFPTRVGDLLYILCGGQMIYTLRPKRGGAFELIGDAYVHGVMDGQLFEDGTFDGKNQETVVLE
ncbi:MAG: hypothetical protein L6R37_007971 [Teloschistes peruensis]|nr:MAG: hypothetical protein L6R37_007971 [Teloschistes peruensis]